MQNAITLAVGILVGLLGGYYVGYERGMAASAVQPIDEAAVAGLLASMERIVGEWRSSDDARFMRRFLDDGTLVDAYEGEAPETDSYWMLFTKDIPDPAYRGPLEEGATYLAIATAEADTMYFEVVRLDETHLELVYLDSSGVLVFTRK